MMPDHEPDALREQAPPYAPPPETQRLIDELYREELREARAMSPEQKLLLGEELFDYACSITLAGIRNQFPEAAKLLAELTDEAKQLHDTKELLASIEAEQTKPAPAPQP